MPPRTAFTDVHSSTTVVAVNESAGGPSLDKFFSMNCENG